MYFFIQNIFLLTILRKEEMKESRITPQYVLGFVFNERRDKVVLVRKKRPSFQVGKLNGFGGSIEEGEGSRQAMVREFKEESGVTTEEDQWTRLGNLYPPNTIIIIYYMFNDSVFDNIRQIEDEELVWKDALALNDFQKEGADHIPYLIPMILEQKVGYCSISSIFD
jgi:8-oxo-dGTP diphosphatase